MGLLDFLQAASNTAAQNVSGPIDLLSWALKTAGVPGQEKPFLGSEWMKEKGLMKDVPQSPYSLAGETVGLLAPIAAVQFAPQIAAWRNMVNDRLAPGAPGKIPTTIPRGAVVYHGSPHKFDKFDSSKIGTGEGAQAYGHGLYLADAQDVAMTYQPRDPKLEQRLMQRYSVAERSQQYPAMQVYEDFLLHKTPDEVAQNIAAAGYSHSDLKAAQDALKIATKEYRNQRAGALYKVDLPDSAIARMLDWDKPLSEQPKAVQEAFEDMVAPLRAEMAKPAPGWGDLASPSKFDPTGQELLGLLRNRNADNAQAFLGNGLGPDVSRNLLQKGIPGIRYLDGGSRAAGSGSSNYVVFPGNENMLRILARNGQPIGK